MRKWYSLSYKEWDGVSRPTRLATVLRSMFLVAGVLLIIYLLMWGMED